MTDWIKFLALGEWSVFDFHWRISICVYVLCDLTYSGRGSGTCQLSPSSLVLVAGVLSGFKLSSLGFSLKFPVRATTLPLNADQPVNKLKKAVSEEGINWVDNLVSLGLLGQRNTHTWKYCTFWLE